MKTSTGHFLPHYVEQSVEAGSLAEAITKFTAANPDIRDSHDIKDAWESFSQ